MIGAGDVENAGASFDYIAIAPHGIAHTHLDALCHVFYKGQMYNGRPAAMVTSRGATANSIEAGIDGIMSRGVLLDIPHALGRDWLEPGEAIYAEDLEAAERAHNLRVEPGDILLVRTGRHRRIARGAGDAAAAAPLGRRIAGLHMSAMPWLKDRGVALLGCDGISDVNPSGLPADTTVGLPVHRITIAAMGIHLLDNAQLDDLSDACIRYGRWQFQLTLAPLRLLRGTASPVNPIAAF
jgi:kynurenine formamidase